MSKKIYLSPSNQTGNKYCVGSTNEGAVQNDIAKLLMKLLEEYDCEVKMADMKMNLTNRAAEAKTWGASVYLAMHSNALNGAVRGVRVYYGNKQANHAARKEFARCVLDQMATMFKNGGLFIDNSYLDCRLPVMPSIIAEVGFHDNKEDATLILNNKSAIAGLYCKALVKYLSLEKKMKAEEKKEEATTAIDKTKPSYKVKKGDTLGEIAKKFSTTAKKLGEYNGIKNINLITVGQIIYLPNAKLYKVKKGDTLGEIAKTYKTTVAKIAKANGIANVNLIRVGATLIIP